MRSPRQTFAQVLSSAGIAAVANAATFASVAVVGAGFTTLLAAPVAVAEIISAPTTAELEAAIGEARSTTPVAAMLVATDLDNTLLELDRDIGSEHWFLWQKSILEGAHPEAAVVVDTPTLLKLQTYIYAVSASHLVDDRLHDIYTTLQQDGGHVIGLTSRIQETRDITRREMARQGLAWSAAALPLMLSGAPTRDGSGQLYDFSNPGAAGLTPEILASENVTSARPVAYAGGVLFTEGQNKGIMLAAYLHQSGFISKASDVGAAAVVFVDDRRHHVEAVERVLTALYPGLRVLAIHYQASRAKVATFEASDKAQAIQDACAILGLLDRQWGTRADKPWRSPVPGCQ